MRLILLLATLALAAGCRDETFIIIERLAPGGGDAADGGNFVNNRPVRDNCEGDAHDYRYVSRSPRR